MKQNKSRMTMWMRRTTVALSAATLLGLALTGCHGSGDETDFSRMSKAEQLKAINDIPAKERDMADKMRANIAATIRAGGSHGDAPQINAPGAGTAH